MEKPEDWAFVVRMPSAAKGQKRNVLTAEELLEWLEKAELCEECGSKLPSDHSPEEVQSCVVKMQQRRDAGA